MKLQLLIAATLIFSFLAKAQNLNDEKLMGEWKAIKVEIPNSSEVPQKDALKFIEDAFLESKWNFKGNKIFKIQYGKTADERIEELFFLDNQNWVIDNNKILIGTENDGFSSMHITYQENNGKTYFLLPMMILEMKKLSNEEPSEIKIVEPKPKKSESTDYLKSELVTKEIDESEIIDFKDIENPPLGPECKSKWDVEKQKECTNRYVSMFVGRKFNTDLASELGLSGKIKFYVEFIIDTDGKPINITADGGPDLLNEHAIEIIGKMPNLKPGMKDGKPINVSYKLPITFQVM